VIFEEELFWVVMLCYVMVGYQSFRGLCFLHLQGGEVKVLFIKIVEVLIQAGGKTLRHELHRAPQIN